jgi:hypothetical protein
MNEDMAPLTHDPRHKLTENLLERVQIPPAPPQDLEPLKESNTTLIKYSLPLCPDKTARPRQTAL